jgi:hypothetical protein
MSALWNVHEGRELDTTPIRDGVVPKRLVACLNTWNDRPALEQTVPSWREAVDHVIVVDGSYPTTGERTLSADGTREYLVSQFPSIEFVDMPGTSQCDKRTAYLERGQPGDYLIIIDADERLVRADSLDALPDCDIGWVRIQSTLYAREYGQPRVIKWRAGLHYWGRHHWMYCYDRLLCTHQYGGPGFVHRPINALLVNNRELGRSPARRAVKATSLAAQSAMEFSVAAMPRSVMSDAATRARESLRVLNYAYRDDGIAASRFHTALNRTTPHSSLFFKVRPGPFNVPTQYDVGYDHSHLVTAVRTTDVIHIHSLMSVKFPTRPDVPIVFHHHGTRLRTNAEKYTEEAKRRHALVLVSNLELLSWTDDYPAEFLPNAVPVGRYAALAGMYGKPFDGTGPFRIAHSPTAREKKGTQAFLDACGRLTQRGYPIEPVLIENTTHDYALAVKATCHAMFDSFWLGIQCSGLEAAAMQLPVVAGDEIVAARYRERFGCVPYTYANSCDELEDVLGRLIEDSAFRQSEAARVFGYVLDYHDESAVALSYLDHLDRAFQWRSALRATSRLQQRTLQTAGR